jgi:hypothetical protein
MARLFAEEIDYVLKEFQPVFKGILDRPSRLTIEVDQNRVNSLDEVTVKVLGELGEPCCSAAGMDYGVPHSVDSLDLPLDVSTGGFEIRCNCFGVVEHHRLRAEETV